MRLEAMNETFTERYTQNHFDICSVHICWYSDLGI